MDSLQRGSRIPIITETIWEQLGALKNSGDPVYAHYAALALSQDMAVNLWTEDFGPVEGRQVSFSMPFDQTVAAKASPSRRSN